MKKADCLGYQLAFYKVSEKYVVTLHEVGFHFTKVGEAGIADLTAEEVPWINQQLEYQKLKNIIQWDDLILPIFYPAG